MSVKSPQASLWILATLILLTILSGCSSHRNSGRVPPVKVPQHVNVSAASTKPAKALLEEADKWLGTPYKYGGTQRGKGVDCSGLVTRLYADALSISLPRNSAAQAEFCKPIDKKKLDIGDLVFFSPNGSGRVNHVGMYIGEGFMIHASGSRGVMVSSLEEPYFKRNYKSSGRVDQYAKMVASASSRRKEKSKKGQPVPGLPEVTEAVKSKNIKIRISPADSVKTFPVTIPVVETTDIDDVIDQKVDSICSSFFE